MEPDTSDQSLGGGGTVEESGMTLPSAAAGESMKDKLRFDIGRSELGIPVKGQDGLPCDKSGITDGIIDGFAQPLPNLDHLIDRRVPPPLIPWEDLKAMLGNTPSIDDDLDDVPLGNACSLNGDCCESCE